MRTSIRASASLGVCMILAGLAGCKTENCNPRPVENYRALGIVNGQCPMMPRDGVDGKHTAMFQGQKVGFCCDDCVPGWNKLSDADKAAKLAKVK